LGWKIEIFTEEKMKRVTLAIIAVGFLAVSCGGGGGNIKKVQNGVFSDYDNTITVGKALENNKILKGGKWKAVEIDGRQYVTYTAKLTGEQVMELMIESLSMTAYKNKPNLWMAERFYSNMSRWGRGVGDPQKIANLTSMSNEEIKQLYAIIGAKRAGHGGEWASEDLEQLLSFDGYEMTLSFVMNQDGTFNTNMLECYTEVTLNCFNNLKVRYNAVNSENSQGILSFIYKVTTPNFFVM
jgi:hypothetical protein